MPKVIKIPLIAITILVGMALICLALVQTSWFKNKATDWATSYLSKELATEVHIGEVQLDYFDALTATDVYIADRSGDTLFFIQNLTADYDLFSFTQDEVRLNHVKIDHGVVKIGNRTDEKGLNLQFLINYFTPPPSGEPKPAPRLVFDKVELIETRFIISTKTAPLPPPVPLTKTTCVSRKSQGICTISKSLTTRSLL